VLWESKELCQCSWRYLRRIYPQDEPIWVHIYVRNRSLGSKIHKGDEIGTERNEKNSSPSSSRKYCRKTSKFRQFKGLGSENLVWRENSPTSPKCDKVERQMLTWPKFVVLTKF
jgi:hypothetical protein